MIILSSHGGHLRRLKGRVMRAKRVIWRGVMGEMARDVWMLGTLERGEVVARYDDVSDSMWWNHVLSSSLFSSLQWVWARKQEKHDKVFLTVSILFILFYENSRKANHKAYDFSVVGSFFFFFFNLDPSLNHKKHPQPIYFNFNKTSTPALPLLFNLIHSVFSIHYWVHPKRGFSLPFTKYNWIYKGRGNFCLLQFLAWRGMEHLYQAEYKDLVSKSF